LEKEEIRLYSKVKRIDQTSKSRIDGVLNKNLRRAEEELKKN